MIVSLLLLLFLKQAMVSAFRKFPFNTTLAVQKFERCQKETSHYMPKILTALLKTLKMTIFRVLGRVTFKTGQLETTLDVGDVKVMTVYFCSSNLIYCRLTAVLIFVPSVQVFSKFHLFYIFHEFNRCILFVLDIAPISQRDDDQISITKNCLVFSSTTFSFSL